MDDLRVLLEPSAIGLARSVEDNGNRHQGETPLRKPTVKNWLLMACSVFLPSPPTPTIEATTTMASDIMMVWLMPAMMVGKASGICTLNSFCRCDEPKASAASSASLSTRRMPRLVSRIIGGTA